MGRHVVLSQKNCWCPQTLSFLRICSQALNSSSIYASISVSARHPAGTASLCPKASVSTQFSALQRLKSKGESVTKCCHRCDGTLTAGHPCHGERYAFQGESLCTAHVLIHSDLFYSHGLLDAVARDLEGGVHLFFRRLTYSAIARPAHSSFNFPSTFLLATLCNGWTFG